MMSGTGVALGNFLLHEVDDRRVILRFIEEMTGPEGRGAAAEFRCHVIAEENDLDGFSIGHVADSPGNLEAITVAQLEVDNDDIGSRGGYCRDGAGHGVGAAADLHAPRIGEELTEHFGELRRIVDDEYAHRRHCGIRHGGIGWTWRTPDLGADTRILPARLASSPHMPDGPAP